MSNTDIVYIDFNIYFSINVNISIFGLLSGFYNSAIKYLLILTKGTMMSNTDIVLIKY